MSYCTVQGVWGQCRCAGGGGTTTCANSSCGTNGTASCNSSCQPVNCSACTTEVCDGCDNDCDSSVDEGVTTTYYRDLDADTYGNASVTTQACSPPTGYVSNSTDCNDNDATCHPGAAEVCDNKDNDCNSAIDNAPGNPNPNTLTQSCNPNSCTQGGSQACTSGTWGTCTGGSGTCGCQTQCSTSGHREEFCYRLNDSTCSTGTPTDKLQWKARSNGSTIQEKTAYSYFNGVLVEERVYDSAEHLRRVKRYREDPYHRSSFEEWGDSATPGNRFHVTKRFNDNDQQAALGIPYDEPPEFCLNGEADCKGFAYDRARRLISVTEYPDGSSPKKTCLFYDTQGNVKEIDFGEDSCAEGDGVRFEYDDFGNVLSVRAPWLGTGSIHYEYDSLGNVVKKATPAMGSDYVKYLYDLTSRTLAAKRVSGTTEETLYSFSYDDAETSSGCTGANTEGRLHVQRDSFGENWFSYNKAGQLTRVYRRRDTGSACAAGHSEAQPNSVYEYDADDGRLTAQEYPHGRRIEYAYGDSSAGMQDRVKQIRARLYLADGGTETKTLIDNVQWEPFGGVASYEALSPTTSNRLKVDYFLGMSSTASGDCSSTMPGASDVDHTGRLRGLWVSKIASPGASGTGDVFKRTYSWKADQLIQEATCLLSTSGQPHRENFSTRDGSAGYDHALRLTHVSRDGGTEFADTGGALGRRDYTYDARGNRLSDVADCWCFQSTYSNRDQLMSRVSASDAGVPGCTCGAVSAFGNTFTYDADGRVAQKLWPDAGIGSEALTFDATIDSSHAALGAVYKGINNEGATYEYFYDAAGRRRAKLYPSGYKDEFFYSGTRILEDRGLSTASASPSSYPIDEYVWLDGRPVVLIKSQFDSGWSRQQDSQGTCTRNSEEAPCGIYFPVTDYLGKPVLLMDSDRRVAGVGDYDPFGHVNHVTYLGDTPHPYGSASERVLGFFSQKPTSTTSVKLRARYAYVDTNSDTYTYLSDQWGAELAGARSEGAHLGRTVTPWVQVPSDGRVHVRFHKGASDLGTRYGAILEGYDYRRYETGASPVWLPLRFPGQYHDAEVDLFENWNRFYDPSIGRYLAPDPVLYAGQAVPVYTYSGNNPIAFADPTGLARMRMWEEIPINARGFWTDFGGTVVLAMSTVDAKFVQVWSLVKAGDMAGAMALAAQLYGTVPRWLALLDQAYRIGNGVAGRCDVVTNLVYKAYQALGMKPEIMQIRVTNIANEPALIGIETNPGVASSTIALSTNGYHSVVMVGNKVVDFFTGPAGQEIGDYAKRLVIEQGSTIVWR